MVCTEPSSWAFATLDQVDVRLCWALAQDAEQCVANFIPQNLANTAWAFVTMGYVDVWLFAALALLATDRFTHDVKLQVHANGAWAFALLGRADAQLFATLAMEVPW